MLATGRPTDGDLRRGDAGRRLRADGHRHGAARCAGHRRRIAVADRRRIVMLDQAQMRAITGAGDDLTIVPSMDGKIPVDVSDLMNGTPQECQWFFAETQTFGAEVEEFHKTTFQNPPDGGLISEGAGGIPRSRQCPPRVRRLGRARVRLWLNANSARRSSVSGRPTPTRCGCGRRARAGATTGSSTSCWPRCPSVRSPTRCPTS